MAIFISTMIKIYFFITYKIYLSSCSNLILITSDVANCMKKYKNIVDNFAEQNIVIWLCSSCLWEISETGTLFNGEKFHA